MTKKMTWEQYAGAMDLLQRDIRLVKANIWYADEAAARANEALQDALCKKQQMGAVLAGLEAVLAKLNREPVENPK